MNAHHWRLSQLHKASRMNPIPSNPVPSHAAFRLTFQSCSHGGRMKVLLLAERMVNMSRRASVTSRGSSSL